MKMSIEYTRTRPVSQLSPSRPPSSLKVHLSPRVGGPTHPGVLATKSGLSGYFEVKSTNVQRVQMGTKPAKDKWATSVLAATLLKSTTKQKCGRTLIGVLRNDSVVRWLFCATPPPGIQSF